MHRLPATSQDEDLPLASLGELLALERVACECQAESEHCWCPPLCWRWRLGGVHAVWRMHVCVHRCVMDAHLLSQLKSQLAPVYWLGAAFQAHVLCTIRSGDKEWLTDWALKWRPACLSWQM
jgi:hypothetical protein